MARNGPGRHSRGEALGDCDKGPMSSLPPLTRMGMGPFPPPKSCPVEREGRLYGLKVAKHLSP
jgi:hypothetical protein